MSSPRSAILDTAEAPPELGVDWADVEVEYVVETNAGVPNAAAEPWRPEFADLIAVAGDPLTDITEMQRVKFVMKGGAVVRNDMAAGMMMSSK